MNNYNDINLVAIAIRGKIANGEGLGPEDMARLHTVASRSGRRDLALLYIEAKAHNAKLEESKIEDKEPQEPENKEREKVEEPTATEPLKEKTDEEKFIEKMNADSDRVKAAEAARSKMDEAYKKAGRTQHRQDQVDYINAKREYNELMARQGKN